MWRLPIPLGHKSKANTGPHSAGPVKETSPRFSGARRPGALRQSPSGLVRAFPWYSESSGRRSWVRQEPEGLVRARACSVAALPASPPRGDCGGVLSR